MLEKSFEKAMLEKALKPMFEKAMKAMFEKALKAMFGKALSVWTGGFSNIPEGTGGRRFT
ncbi:MAG: hypothetical protein IJH81_05535 [Lachnospiraceae bacterium]|nr:hypothetical protein [Lachnospiraceae bacterium]